jgi:adenosyl cobinamide kinase/adenosyl cobinamide phosphate guanylyltransferase
MSGVHFILGGARSGKSRHAEALVQAWPQPWSYIATAQAFDDEMRARIAEHRTRRPDGWRTIDAPLDLAQALREAGDTPVLIDCLTLWLTNLILGEHDIVTAVAALLAALSARKALTVVVSNEVGLGIVPDNALSRRFRDEAGVLHQRVAEVADHVVLVVAGLPLQVK